MILSDLVVCSVYNYVNLTGGAAVTSAQTGESAVNLTQTKPIPQL